MGAPRLVLNGTLPRIRPETAELDRALKVSLSLIVPFIVRAVGKRAAAGDLEAARLLFQCLGLLVGGSELRSCGKRSQNPTKIGRN